LQICFIHPLDITNNAAIVALAKELFIDLVVIGPEVPLINGASDALRSAGFKVFGPSKAASQLQIQKSSQKALCEMLVFICFARNRFMQGEFSLSAICDGRNIIAMQPTQNFEPNGMGAFTATSMGAR
jgi:phosphoribosylamine-glycine ligase